MKAIKKFFAAALALAMLLTLYACGEDKKNKKEPEDGKNTESTQSSTATYQVTVLDGQGEPMTAGVVVKFMKDGEQMAMEKLNADGIATKELAKGDYTVELMFTDNTVSGSYDKEAAVLTADKTTLELTLINDLGNNTMDLVVDSVDYIAYNVRAGSTAVPVKASVRNYFIFTPTEAGTFDFRVDNAEIKLGYYGGTHFVQTQSAVDVIDNVVTLSISASALGGNYVIGLDGLAEDTDAVLSIIRTGDPTTTISDLPWTEYKTTHTPAPYTLSIPSGKSLKYVDIMGKTEDNQIIFNESDGYYHYGNANGPVVLVHLGKGAPYVSLQTVIEGDGLGGGSPIRNYFFDSAGNFIKKEDYTDILCTYFENMDSKNYVYPLTKDLEYIIKNGCHGWWDKDNPDYIFTDCNPEIGWMFALCYVG